MIVRQHSRSGGAGDLLDYLIINRGIADVRASRVADIAVHNLPVMPAIPKTPNAAHELVRALTRSMDGFIINARLSSVRILKTKLIHAVTSFDPKDPTKLGKICGGPVAVTRELAKNVVGPNRAMVFALHDSNHLHVHTLISSTDTYGRAWDSSFDRYKWNTEARKIEHKYELTPLTFDPERHSLSPTEHRRLQQFGIPDLLERMRSAICAARADSPARDVFERRLGGVGITIEERKDRDGNVRGLVFNYGEVTVKGSAIHRGLSYRKLMDGFNPERVAFDRDHEQDIRNVMLLSLADEESRREAIQHSRASVRYLGIVAEELRAGKVNRTWTELDRVAQLRLSARPQLVPVSPKFVKVERAEPVPLARKDIRLREDQNGSRQHAPRDQGSGRNSRNR
jgi:hypothetical protein